MEANFTNRTVWTGDNLDILRGFNSGCVDLIYLDPPFNSNRDYAAPIGSRAAGAAFKDTWTLDDVDLAWHGEIADRHSSLYGVIAASHSAHGQSMMSYLIMMAVRLLELKRVLKPTGTIFLHCDPTANAYLRTVMDAVFLSKHFVADITWKRTSAHNDRLFASVCDSILCYGAPPRYGAAVRVPLDPEYVKRYYRHEDERGRYRHGDLTGPKTSAGESGEPWNGVDPTKIGRCWSVPRSGVYARWIEENIIPGYCGLGIHDRLDALDAADMIHWPDRGYMPSLKRYLRENQGQLPSNVWTDIKPASRKERVGYPTQKPLKLLERIIKASTRPGDVVLDPFCGCATTLEAAEKLNRQWVGIDLSSLAVKLVDQRLRKNLGLFGQIIARTDIPHRTDLGELPNYRTHKHTLFGKQEGLCNGCWQGFQFRNFTIDHIVPRSKGGTDHFENLQLLCHACNSKKGIGSHADLLARLREEKVIPDLEPIP